MARTLGINRINSVVISEKCQNIGQTDSSNVISRTARHLQKDSRPLIPHDFLTSLWNEHSATLQLIARSHCTNPEDCVQEAFVRLSKQTHLPGDPMAWLVRVTRNEAISKWRSENRRKSHEQKHASERTLAMVAKRFRVVALASCRNSLGFFHQSKK